ncbi:MAG: hypothetical protein HZC14_03610, partial [Candidatus Niyogibacteria bacterium]|nr:hypothetical protein [Candidatus Niyogibacteria bacterium]
MTDGKHKTGRLKFSKTRRIFVMLRAVFVILMLLFFTGVFAGDVMAVSGVPSVISYQGRLSDSSDNLLGGSGTTYYFKFSIWDNATINSGNRLWPAAAPSTTTANVKNGVFNVNIGDTASGYPDALVFNFNTNSAIYLQVEVSSNNSTYQTLSPRQRIAASAFAQLAGAVSGTSTPSSFGTTTPIGNSVVTIEASSTSAIPLSLRAASGQIANIFQIQNSANSDLLFVNSSGGLFASSTLQVTGNTILYGNLGVGTTTPAKNFAVQGDSLFSGDIFFANLTATGTTRLNGNTYAWPASITSGNFLQTDSSGNLTWATASGGGGGGGFDSVTTEGGFIRLATTTNRVGIGTTTPYAKLSIGQTNGAGIATTTLAIQPVSGQTANIIDIFNTSGNLTTTLDVNNLLTIGGGIISRASSSITSSLHVSGLLNASSTLLVGGGSAATSTFTSNLDTAANLEADRIQTVSTTASSTFANGINLTKGCFSI